MCGFGIFQLAAALGSIYLVKRESLGNFRSGMRVLASIWVAPCVAIPYKGEGAAPEPAPATAADAPALPLTIEAVEKAEQLEVLRLMRDLLGWLFMLHRVGRTGNSALVFEALCALSPPFPATGSNLYTGMLARFVYEVHGEKPSPVREQPMPPTPPTNSRCHIAASASARVLRSRCRVPQVWPCSLPSADHSYWVCGGVAEHIRVHSDSHRRWRMGAIVCTTR